MGSKQFTLHSMRAGQSRAMSYSKTIISALTTIAFAATSQVAAAAPGDLERVQAHLKAVSSMTANFVQTDRGGKSLNGVLTLARPGKIRFQYQKGTPILLVSDGSALTFIDYSVKQVQRWPVKNSPLGILLDPDRDMSRYAKILAGSSSQSLLTEGIWHDHAGIPKERLSTLRFDADGVGLSRQSEQPHLDPPHESPLQRPGIR
jgi:Outer membrane lipoprotein carrier protein LolA